MILRPAWLENGSNRNTYKTENNYSSSELIIYRNNIWAGSASSSHKLKSNLLRSYDVLLFVQRCENSHNCSLVCGLF